MQLSGPFTRVERVGLVIALGLAAALMWPTRGYLTDDTFIHLQYARHVSQARGLVFNQGERVYGCTSPLWIALLADGMAVGLDGLDVARALGFVSTLASVVFFLQLLRRTVGIPAIRAVATVAWASHAWMIRWSLSGMETALAVALVLAGFVAFTEGNQWASRPLRTGSLWALAALTRPEATLLLVLWFALLLIDADTREGLRRLVFGSLPPLLIYGSWLIFSRLYFGSFWPQTLSAKSAGGDTAEFLRDNLWRQARLLGATDGLLVLLLLLALVAGGRAVWSGGRPALRLLPWLWLLALPAFSVARGVPVVSRYVMLILPILAMLAWRAAEQWWVGEDPGRARRRLGTWLAAALAAMILIQNLLVYRNVVLPQVRSFSPALTQSLVHWGRWFQENSHPDDVIATPDIGAIGYYSDRRVLDLAGLVTPEMIPILARMPQEEAVASFSFASFDRPAFLVDRAPVPHDLIRRSRFAACLTPLGTARVPNLGIARPEPAVYTFYRIDWSAFESLRPAVHADTAR